MATALYPGSFDPFHLGHLDVVEQIAGAYDGVVVAAVGNPAKSGLLTLPQRAALIAASVAHLGNVRAVYHDGLVATLARDIGADVLVRAAGKEASNELVMAAMNVRSAGVRTVLVAPSAATARIGSRFLRELAAGGRTAELGALVPPAVHRYLEHIVAGD